MRLQPILYRYLLYLEIRLPHSLRLSFVTVDCTDGTKLTSVGVTGEIRRPGDEKRRQQRNSKAFEGFVRLSDELCCRFRFETETRALSVFNDLRETEV